MLDSSIVPKIPLAKLFTVAYINVVGMATIKPNHVVTRATEIPLAIVLGSPVPNKVIIVKVSIIPIMVPNRPIKGATTETILRTQLRPSIVGLSFRICSAILSSKVSVSALNIDGATDIGADLTTSDLIVVDDGAGGTNRKAALSRIVTLVDANSSAASAGFAVAMAIAL